MAHHGAGYGARQACRTQSSTQAAPCCSHLEKAQPLVQARSHEQLPPWMELDALHCRTAGLLLVGILHTHHLKHMGGQHAAAAQQRASAAL